MKEYRTVNYLGIPVTDITTSESLDLIDRWVQEFHMGGPARQIVTVNPEFVMVGLANPQFRRVLHQADLAVPDGIGLHLTAPLLGARLRERVTGSDTLPLIAEQAARLGHRLFLLGAAPGIAQETARRLLERYPGLQIAGCYAGSPARVEEAEIVAIIRAARTDILAVAYGAPQQDIWIARNLARTGAAIALGVGGAFDHITGVKRRAPQLWQKLGLEWAFRLVTQPWRWKRMLKLPLFVLLVVLAAAGKPIRQIVKKSGNLSQG